MQELLRLQVVSAVLAQLRALSCTLLLFADVYQTRQLVEVAAAADWSSTSDWSSPLAAERRGNEAMTHVTSIVSMINPDHDNPACLNPAHEQLMHCSSSGIQLLQLAHH